MNTQVIHARDLARYPDAIYIGREHSGRGRGPSFKRSRWANPFTWHEHGRDLAVALYSRWITGDPEAAAMLPAGNWHRPSADEIRRELRGRVLACWCDPQPCHGHVIAAIADETPGGEVRPGNPVEKGTIEMTSPETIHDYVVHRAASVFPLMEGKDFQSLVDSIAVHGVQNPIVSYKGEVLDGRNRLRAVMKLRDEGRKVDLPCVEWDEKCGMSATEWVAAQNLDRRHLSADAYVTATAAINRILRNEAKERQKSGQAKAGQASKNPSGRRGKKTGGDQTVAASSRDSKKKDAASTAGQVAAKAGVSLRKAKQAVKLDKAVEAGVVPEEVQRDVVAGKRKLNDVVATLPASQPAKAKAAARPTDDLRSAVVKRWGAMREWDKHWARADMRDVRRLFIEVIRDEQKQFDK